MSRALSKVEGVRDVEVDLRTGNVRISFDADLASEQVLKETITSTGYDVVS